MLRPSIINERFVNTPWNEESQEKKAENNESKQERWWKRTSCIKLYVRLFQLNWRNPDRRSYSLRSRRICLIATRDDETERGLWRAKDDSKREDDGANLYLNPKWWPNVMKLKKKKWIVTSRLVAVPLVGVESTAGASRHPWLYRLSLWFNVN